MFKNSLTPRSDSPIKSDSGKIKLPSFHGTEAYCSPGSPKNKAKLAN